MSIASEADSTGSEGDLWTDNAKSQGARSATTTSPLSGPSPDAPYLRDRLQRGPSTRVSISGPSSGQYPLAASTSPSHASHAPIRPYQDSSHDSFAGMGRRTMIRSNELLIRDHDGPLMRDSMSHRALDGPALPT